MMTSSAKRMREKKNVLLRTTRGLVQRLIMVERQLSLTPSQLAKAKDAIELLSSLTSPSTVHNSGRECSSSQPLGQPRKSNEEGINLQSSIIV